jgi:hypothetical protein
VYGVSGCVLEGTGTTGQGVAVSTVKRCARCAAASKRVSGGVEGATLGVPWLDDPAASCRDGEAPAGALTVEATAEDPPGVAPGVAPVRRLLGLVHAHGVQLLHDALDAGERAYRVRMRQRPSDQFAA